MRIGVATLLAAMLALLSLGPATAGEKELERLAACRRVVGEMADDPEGIPRGLLDKAACIVVVPGVKKLALGLGGRLGWGAALCRVGPSWSSPLMVSLKGGGFGLQIGAESTDFVLLVMDSTGIDHLLRSKFTLGADASIAAGPVGRNAEAATDATLHAEILSYSRGRGLFAGISLEGASLAQDKTGNDAIYGDRLGPRRLLTGPPPKRLPPVARDLADELTRLSPR